MLDDKIEDKEANKKLGPIFTKLSIRRRKVNISFFISVLFQNA